VLKRVPADMKLGDKFTDPRGRRNVRCGKTRGPLFSPSIRPLFRHMPSKNAKPMIQKIADLITSAHFLLLLIRVLDAQAQYYSTKVALVKPKSLRSIDFNDAPFHQFRRFPFIFSIFWLFPPPPLKVSLMKFKFIFQPLGHLP
jgi:hypothetical protein